MNERQLRLADWQRWIEADLFGLPEQHPGLSGRMLLSFLIRRTSSHGFNSPVRSFPQQREVDAIPNLAYLLGLDAGLAMASQRPAQLVGPVSGRTVACAPRRLGWLNIRPRPIRTGDRSRIPVT
jgi:hypothetical protein